MKINYFLTTLLFAGALTFGILYAQTTDTTSAAVKKEQCVKKEKKSCTDKEKISCRKGKKSCCGKAGVH